MSLVINTNIASMNAQNNLSKSQSALDQALSRLSSGLRINSPADDPAGYAIAQRMTSQINGFNQAVRNANDGISFAQVANGALNTVTDSLQRIRTLAIQAANSTNSPQDRQALNSEVQQSIQQVNSTAQSTQFNGQSILNGSLSSLTFQVGANAGQTITTQGLDVRGQNLGASYGDGNSVLTSEISGLGSITIAGSSASASVDLSSATSVSDVAAAINNVSSETGVYAQRADTTKGTFSYTNSGASTITVNGVDVSVAAGATETDVISAINAYSDQTGVTAKDNGGNIDLSNSSGADITVAASTTDFQALDSTGANVALNAGAETFSAGIELYTKVGGSITVTDNAGLDAAKVGIASVTASNTLTLNSASVSTEGDAKNAIKAMDFALSQLSRFGGQLGAMQSRFQATISNLQTASQNTEAARSRIQDANFASETASLSRAKILQQAGVAMVAQANAQPQIALSLLK
ncbi:MAG: flagellin [Gammaproteobacteria bacterium]|jgi:flagellin